MTTAPAPVDVEVTVTPLDDRAVRVTLDAGEVILSADMNRDAAIEAALAILSFAEAGAIEINTDARVVVWLAAAPADPQQSRSES